MYHYRADIDGLRALAVLPVLLFHAGLSQFSGGYIGVDIFFVISGYLITSIIVVELERDRFTILGFYERRIRRIFPALFTVIFFSVLVAHFLMLPNEYKDFGQSVFATTFFFSNVLFWIEAGYFDAESLMKPLLHTWSLAVEEQYYIFYPPLLIFIYKVLNRRGVPIILGLWALSLAWSVWSTNHYPSMAFYLAPSRVWELLTGAILALGYIREVENKSANEWIGIVGLAMVLYAIFGFDHTTRFPGYAALIPCVGTAMIIYSGASHNTLVSRFLTNRIFIFTGLISYSLYLWHWPILVFSHLYLDKPFEPWLIALLLGLSYLFAWVSWRYIEKPFRGKQSKYTRKQMFSGAAVLMAGVSAFGLALHITNGLPSRLPDHVNQIAGIIESYNTHLPEHCLLKGEGQAPVDVTLCDLNKARSDEDSVVLWGDSHAASFVPALKNIASHDDSIAFKFIGMQGCPPLKNITVAASEDSFYESCTAFNDAVLAKLKNDKKVKVVILSAHWSLYSNGVRLPTDPNHGDLYLTDEDADVPLEVEHNNDYLRQGMIDTIEPLLKQGKKIIIIGPVPEIEINGASTIARMELLDSDRDVRPAWQSIKQRLQASVDIFRDLQDGQDVMSIFPHMALCQGQYCQVSRNDMPLYRDRHHLTPDGAVFVLDKLQFSRMLSAELGHGGGASFISKNGHDR